MKSICAGTRQNTPRRSSSPATFDRPPPCVAARLDPGTPFDMPQVCGLYGVFAGNTGQICFLLRNI
jgi:hypothetical protein